MSTQRWFHCKRVEGKNQIAATARMCQVFRLNVIHDSDNFWSENVCLFHCWSTEIKKKLQHIISLPSSLFLLRRHKNSCEWTPKIYLIFFFKSLSDGFFFVHFKILRYENNNKIRVVKHKWNKICDFASKKISKYCFSEKYVIVKKYNFYQKHHIWKNYIQKVSQNWIQ